MAQTPSPGAESGLSIRVLGRVSAARGGQALDLGGRQQRAILASLVLARGGPVPADRLIDTLWNDRPPPGALGAVQSYVSHLRRGLEPDRGARARESVIVSRAPGYALEIEPDAVDAWRFDRLVAHAPDERDPAAEEARLEAALALWVGPAYAEYAEEHWAEAEVARLTELREVAREQLMAARLAQGHSVVLVPELEAMVAADPLREERWRLLVLALYRAQRQSQALATLRRARRVLADEVGVDPGPALQTLEAQVLAQSSSLQWSGATDSPGDRPRAAPELVDREQELAELRRALADVVAGRGRMLLFEGPAGIGKTRLLAEAQRLARDGGFRVLTARGSALEKEYGFGAARQLLESTVARMTATELDGAAASVFAAGPARDSADGAGGFAVLHGLYRLVVGLAAAGPVLLSIDDIQWCDGASLRFLAYLVRRLEGLPVLLVATLRTGEAYEDDLVLAELAYDPVTVRVRPGPLTAAGAADLVRARLGEHAHDTFVAACYRATSGNPLLLRQLLEALAADHVPPDATHAETVTAIGSRAISSLVLMRLARLPAASSVVATAVAVLGPGADLRTVAALAQISEAEAAYAAGALARAEILQEDYPLAFVHPLVADAVYHDLAAGQRQLHHSRAARLLEDAGAAPENVAAQLLPVPPRGDPWVVNMLRQAAARARDRAAPDAAAALLTRALQESSTGDVRREVLLELGQSEAISNAPAAAAHLREAYEGIEDPVRAADLALTLGRTLVFVGPSGAASELARTAAARLPAALVDERQALLAMQRISGYLDDVDPAQWRHEPPPVVGGGPGARMLSVALAWEQVMDGVDRAGAIEQVRFGVADDRLLQSDTGLLYVIAGQVLDLCDEDSAPLWAAGLVQARRRGDLFTTLGMQLWRGYMLWGRGDLREAQQLLSAGNEMSQVWAEGGTASGYGEAFLLGVLIDTGDLTAARTFLEQIRPHHRVAEGARMFGHLQARLLLAEGRPEAALASVDAVQDLMAGVRNPAWRPWRSLRAEALHRLGRAHEARALIDDELALARLWGAPRVIGRTLRLRGQLRGRDGREDLEEAIGLLSTGMARVEEARALIALAGGRPAGPATVGLLRQALEVAGVAGS